MVDKLDKAISKLSNTEKKIMKIVLSQIKKGDVLNLDIKKLKDRTDIFRVRKGQIRIIYRQSKKKDIKILHIGRRSDLTYKNI